jgi:quercetin dioxygenase-like cupin family protein
MIQLISCPKRVPGGGQPPELIEEFIGRVNSGTADVSVARLVCQAGWIEPGQTPNFDEFTVVLRGVLRVETKQGVHRVGAGQAIMVGRGEWVRYSTPEADGAEYIAVCLPAFSPEAAHRDA